MIRLEIYPEGQNKPLVPNLPADVSFEMIRENPLFKRRGDYTYDIDIPLRDPHNRKIYQHIDRLWANSRPTGRKIKLIYGGITICEGSELILKKEDDVVKIQILAGYSELNILTADENLRIRDMNFGTIPELTPETPAALAKLNEVANKIYPQTNYVFPVLTKDSETAAINYATYFYGSVRDNQMPLEMLPQPFLLYYVEKFVELLGYSLKFNYLRNQPKWCRLVVIHGYKTWEYAKMLPNWTASEFITYIEQFFNCIFVVDNMSKEVEIREFHDWYSGRTPVIVKGKEITDSFTREYDEENESFYNYYKNVSYSLPSTDYFKYASLNEEAQRDSEKLTMRPSEAEALQNFDWKIFTDPDYGYQFVRLVDQTRVQNREYNQMVNHFAPYIVDRNASNTELKITPAEINIIDGEYVSDWEDLELPDIYDLYHINAKPQIYENRGNSGFNDVILNGIKDNASDIMQVAFYAGVIHYRDELQREWVNNVIGRYGYPVCFTQPRTYVRYWFGITNAEVSGIEAMTLELNGSNGMAAKVYTGGNNADISQKHTIYFKSNGILNPNDLYNIAGRLFICQQIKYTFAKGKRHPVAEGVFYPYYL